MGDAHNILGEFDAAYGELSRAYAGLHTHPLSQAERRHAADLARRLGRLRMWKGQHDNALAWLAEGQRKLGEPADADDRATAALLHIHRGSVHYNRGRIDEAGVEGQAGLTLVAEDVAPAVQAEGFNLLAIVAWARGEDREALDYFDHSHRAWQSVGNTYQAMRVLGNIGVVYFHTAEWEVAQRHYAACRAYWESIGDRDMLAHTLLNQGNIHLCQGRLDEAQLAFEAALEPWQSAQSQRWIALSHINLGHVAIEREQWQTAHERLTVSRTLLTDLAIRDLLPENDAALAEAALGMGRPEAAIELARQAEALARELEMQPESAAGLRVLGRAHLVLGRHAESLHAIEASLAISRLLATSYEVGRTLFHLM